MAVRTGGPGAAGLSLLLVPLKGQAGVTMRRLKVSPPACLFSHVSPLLSKSVEEVAHAPLRGLDGRHPLTRAAATQVQGQISAGTTYISLDDVRVPAANLIGRAGMGMRYIMTNFNHERLVIAVGVTAQARAALAAAFAYTLRRRAFGAALVEQPVVRHRLAKAGAELEALHAWVEGFVYAMAHLSKDEADVRLGGLTALAKAKAGMVLSEVAQTAVLLFGGNGVTRSGQGQIAEMVYREVMCARIPGGSEDVMLDLAVRQLVKNYRAGEDAVQERPKGQSKI